MANLKIELEGEGIIDNAVIYLEDPQERIPYFLNPNPSNQKKWTKNDISIPIDDELDYSLYVVAFSGTSIKCTITDQTSKKKLEFEGITGRIIKNRLNIKGSQKLN